LAAALHEDGELVVVAEPRARHYELPVFALSLHSSTRRQTIAAYEASTLAGN